MIWTNAIIAALVLAYLTLVAWLMGKAPSEPTDETYRQPDPPDYLKWTVKTEGKDDDVHGKTDN